jgi:hypothetical protein
MPTTSSPATPLVRPLRPDRLLRGGAQLRTRLVAAGVSRSDAADLVKGVLAVARGTRAYQDGIRALLRARTMDGILRALKSLRKATLQLHERVEEMAPLLERALMATGDGDEAVRLADVWFRGGGPRELAAEGRLRRAMAAHFATRARIRATDLAHLACLWSDAQRYHAALRAVLNAPPTRKTELAGFLEAVSGYMMHHVLPVDLVGLSGDPGLLDGIPAMMRRLEDA